jgi:DNA-binding transcriptional regulator YiaG
MTIISKSFEGKESKMAKSFSRLRAKMTPTARQRSAARAREMMASMPLHELRQAMQMSQDQLARELHVKQANVSKIERRTDMYISTLRSYVQAMGGDLEIIARFSHGSVKIDQFEEMNAKGTARGT